MPRFLSPEWFAEVTRGPDRPGSSTEPGGGNEPGDRLVLEQLVTDTPYGDIRYQVVVSEGEAWIERAGRSASEGPDASAAVSISSDYGTAAAIARGQLSTQRALMEGRLRVRARTAVLAARAGDLVGLDPLSAELRNSTTY